MARSQDQLAEFAMRAERRQLGDTAEWQAAENRWVSQGVDFLDLNAVPASGIPFDQTIATVGFPWGVSSLQVDGAAEWSAFDLGPLFNLFETAVSAEIREDILWLMCFVALRDPDAPDSNFARLAAIIQGEGERGHASLFLHQIAAPRLNL
jgi:hypothetical protein